MNPSKEIPPRLHITLVVVGIALVVGVVLYEMYSVMLSPMLGWQRERTEDRAVYQKLTGVSARTDVESTLSGWKSEPLTGTNYCELLLKRRAAGTDSCKAADHEVVYQRQRNVVRAAPLTPLKIIVVYDLREQVVAASTLD